MSQFKFSAGPWNLNEGVETFGPAVRNTVPFEEAVKKFKEIGISAVQFHDDDAVPNMNNMTIEEIKAEARNVKKILDKYGMEAEFVAPRLWISTSSQASPVVPEAAVSWMFAILCVRSSSVRAGMPRSWVISSFLMLLPISPRFFPTLLV